MFCSNRHQSIFFLNNRALKYRETILVSSFSQYILLSCHQMCYKEIVCPIRVLASTENAWRKLTTSYYLHRDPVYIQYVVLRPHTPGPLNLRLRILPKWVLFHSLICKTLSLYFSQVSCKVLRTRLFLNNPGYLCNCQFWISV